MKRVLAMILSAALAISAFAGCNGNTKPSSDGGSSAGGSTTVSTGGEEPTNPDNPWADIMDYSEEVELSVIAFGTEQMDHDRVMQVANEKMKDLINTTLKVEYVSLADFPTKYPLLLTGGEDLDLVYVATYAFYSEQVNKGAFRELTSDFIKTYMPVTAEVQDESTYALMDRDGKRYCITRNEAADLSYGAWMIRSDIAEQYDYKEEDFKSIDDLKAFLLDLASKNIGADTGVFPWYCFPSLPMENQILVPYENWFGVGGLFWKAGTPADPESCFYMYTSDEWKNYIKEMAEFAKAGVWPSNAITGVTHTNDLFNEGRSVVVADRHTEASTSYKALREKGMDAWYINLQQDGAYTRPHVQSEGIAIAASSKNPERAAVALDIMKNQEDIHLLLVGGIEGEHYIMQDDGTRIVGPAADKYGWDSWSWGFRNDTDPKLDTYPEVKKVVADFESRKLPDDEFPFIGFSFDNTPVASESAVISSIVTEYDYSFDLGVFGDETEAKYDQFVSELEAAGLEKYLGEIRSQISKYLGK